MFKSIDRLENCYKLISESIRDTAIRYILYPSYSWKCPILKIEHHSTLAMKGLVGETIDIFLRCY